MFETFSEWLKDRRIKRWHKRRAKYVTKICQNSFFRHNGMWYNL